VPEPHARHDTCNSILREDAMTKGLAVDASWATARDVMNPSLLTVRQDDTLQELSAFLAENNITGAPVVDASGHFVGVVSATDIAEAESEVGAWRKGDDVDAADRRGFHVEGTGRRVQDIMTPTIYTVTDDTPVSELARAMISGRVHRLFVTRRGKIVGIVTSLDLLRLLCGELGSSTPAPRPSRPHHRARRS
jgi:CBS domain-containing protein